MTRNTRQSTALRQPSSTLQAVQAGRSGWTVLILALFGVGVVAFCYGALLMVWAGVCARLVGLCS